ncbi:MAG: CBS domain-containing protein [Desulfuromonadales bacterium]|jgi:CBS domain-containing protein|nr:CBS domain-containing protein [Desulfuromonadales bacterium]MDH3809310.1 CBS domain-containing protein [Desulfuromonadales bacterium]MDH3869309.1 CBS domain-containing protein [Desulfuromonadales bacterium]MDH3959998.1 CBS domain-containing protein [Desulfuromonadales bacterium]
MSKSIAQILKIKGSDVWSISSDATVYDALVLMAEKGVGALVVIDKGELVGIFTERDHARKVDLEGRCSQKVAVRQVMSVDICYITPQTSVDEAMSIVTESRRRHLPVMENDQLVGLASIGDLVKASLDEKDFVIKQLKKYIKGDP